MSSVVLDKLELFMPSRGDVVVLVSRDDKLALSISQPVSRVVTSILCSQLDFHMVTIAEILKK